MNSTPNNAIAKTVSARKRIILLAVGGALLVTAATYSLASFLHQAQRGGDVTLKSGNKSYTLGVATTPRAQHRGLGNRSSLPKDQGMLFSFTSPAVQCFWMRDMQFPLDMIWVSSSKRVEYVQANVSPDTYPHTFCPNVSASYVIELNAGQAKQAAIHTDEVLHF